MNNISISFDFFSGLSSVMTKTVSLNQNTNNYDTNNMYLIATSSQSASIGGAAGVAQHLPIHTSITARGSSAMAGGETLSSSAAANTAIEAPKISQQKIIQKDLKNLSITERLKQQQQQQQFQTKSKTIDGAVTPGTMATAAVAEALVAAPALGVDTNANEHLEHNSLEELYKEPMYFGTENSSTITTQIGANAHLPCIIHHIGEGVVSIFSFPFVQQLPPVTFSWKFFRFFSWN